MRLFIGIKAGCPDSLCSMQQELERIGKGNFTERNNLHITLRFLGEVPPPNILDIHTAMSEVKAESFVLGYQGMQMFNKNGIVAAKIGGELGKLFKLYSMLEAALGKVGFEREYREYKPHITLARNYRAIQNVDLGLISGGPCEFVVDEIILFESKRVDGRLVYTPLFVHKIAGHKGGKGYR